MPLWSGPGLQRGNIERTSWWLRDFICRCHQVGLGEICVYWDTWEWQKLWCCITLQSVALNPLFRESQGKGLRVERGGFYFRSWHRQDFTSFAQTLTFLGTTISSPTWCWSTKSFLWQQRQTIHNKRLFLGMAMRMREGCLSEKCGAIIALYLTYVGYFWYSHRQKYPHGHPYWTMSTGHRYRTWWTWT